MLIRQEETEPVSDIFYNMKIDQAFSLVEGLSTDMESDTELLKAAVDETMTMLKDFMKAVEKLESKIQKDGMRNKVRSMIDRGREDD